jgi:hypothetical protein
MPYRPDLCLDFDGVVHSYTSGWQGPLVISDLPTPGAFRWIWKASHYWVINIYSSRSKEPGAIEAMKYWFRDHAIHEFRSTPSMIEDFLQVLKFPTQKPSAIMTIDDRAFCFEGNWEDPRLDPQVLLKFKPWNKRESSTRTLPSHIQHLIDAIDGQPDLQIHLEACILKELYGPITK